MPLFRAVIEAEAPEVTDVIEEEAELSRKTWFRNVPAWNMHPPYLLAPAGDDCDEASHLHATGESTIAHVVPGATFAFA